MGVEGEGVRVGEMKGESELGLELFKEEGGGLIERGGNERKEVIVVDDKEFEESVRDIDEVEVSEVIEDEGIGKFERSGGV